jgi:type II secretory pathway pseudopilin PulG
VGLGVVDKQTKAYTLVEMIIVLLFLAAFAAVAVPRINFSAITKKKADTLARRITTDLRHTRTLAVSNGAINTVGFGLYMLGGGPYSSYEIRNLDTSGVVSSHTITPGISCTGGATFNFGPFGDLLAGSDTSLTVSAEGKTYTITIISATGMVKCVES